jgi:hypothetical protein
MSTFAVTNTASNTIVVGDKIRATHVNQNFTDVTNAINDLGGTGHGVIAANAVGTTQIANGSVTHAKLSITSDTFDMNNDRFINLADPIDDQDAATKKSVADYVLATAPYMVSRRVLSDASSVQWTGLSKNYAYKLILSVVISGMADAAADDPIIGLRFNSDASTTDYSFCVEETRNSNVYRDYSTDTSCIALSRYGTTYNIKNDSGFSGEALIGNSGLLDTQCIAVVGNFRQGVNITDTTINHHLSVAGRKNTAAALSSIEIVILKKDTALAPSGTPVLNGLATLIRY